MVTPEGAEIDVADDVTGWTPQQVYDILRPNAYQLGLIGPHLTVKVQTLYPSSTATSAGMSGANYTTFGAIIYLDARPDRTFTDRPDYTIAHEYGHAWTMYHLYITQQGDWTPWLLARHQRADVAGPPALRGEDRELPDHVAPSQDVDDQVPASRRAGTDREEPVHDQMKGVSRIRLVEDDLPLREGALLPRTAPDRTSSSRYSNSRFSLVGVLLRR